MGASWAAYYLSRGFDVVATDPAPSAEANLLQMPGWTRRLRIVIDWTFALLFRPDIVKIGLDSEAIAVLRE